MSRVTRREWYRRVNDAWPAQVPTMTDDEAVRAAKRLYRFAMKRTWRGDVGLTYGNRYTWVRGGVLVVNPQRGWQSLVHLLSHYCVHRLYPDERSHGAEHARLELRMIKQVVRRGWLDGKLKTLPKSPTDRRQQHAIRSYVTQLRLETRLKRWRTKQKLAHTMVTKLTRQLRSAQRRLTKAQQENVVT